jgi:parvulin-like peptidyl-prolyl isomerase
MTGAARCAIGLLGAATLIGCSAQDEWIARVDGREISLGELEAALAPRVESEPDAPRDELVQQELERLVVERIALNRALALDVEVSEAEVRGRIRELAGADDVAATEIASREYLEQLRRQMTIDRAAVLDMADRVQITESAIVHSFEQHRDEYAEPERVQIRQIVVAEEEKAHKLLAEIREGADFAELARQHSIAPEAAQDGLLPAFAKGEMPEEFDRAFALRPHQVSPVTASAFGFHIFKHEATLPAREPVLEEVRDRVRLRLERERLAELRREWMRALRLAADIRVNDELLVSLE